MMDSHELARLCTMDLGQEITSDEVRNYLLVGDKALERFSPEDRQDIASTLLKEMGAATDGLVRNTRTGEEYPVAFIPAGPMYVEEA